MQTPKTLVILYVLRLQQLLSIRKEIAVTYFNK